MKINLKTLISSTLFFAFNIISAQTFEWTKSFGGTDTDIVYSIAIGSTSGSVYTTGYFRDTVDFDPGSGISNLTSVGIRDGFIQKMDANGNFLWAKSFGGIFSDIGYSLALDTSENLYLTGTLDADIFVQKMDVNGNILWAKSFGGLESDYGRSIAIDASGNVYTTGSFQDVADFDPGPETYNLTATGSGVWDIFVQKMDTNGNFLWAKNFGGSSYDHGLSIAIDASGNVYTTGNFQGTADFDPGSGTSIYTTTPMTYFEGFVQKMDTNGNFLWARPVGRTNDSAGGNTSIALDAFGNVYTTGSFLGTVDFDSGPGTSELTSLGNRDGFIHKMGTNGNFLWAKSFGGTDLDGVNSITVDVSGNIYLTGYFQGTVDFDPGSGINNLTSGGIGDVFVQKLDSNGIFHSAKTFGGANNDLGLSIAVDSSGNLYTAGVFSDTVDFDPDSGTNNLTSIGDLDVFVQVMSQSNLGVHEFSNNIKIIAYPNPTEGTVHIKFDQTINDVQFILTDILGKVLKVQTYRNIADTKLELPSAKGIYFLTIKAQESQNTMKIVKK